jgi:signal transduction histidine kinase
MFLDRITGLFKRSIPSRILAALLSIYLATYFATAAVVYTGVRTSILEADRAALNRLADLKYDQLVNQMSALATDLTAWSQLDVMNDLASGDIDKRVAQALDDLKRSYRLPGDLYAFDLKGTLLASSNNIRASGSQAHIPAEWLHARRTLTLSASSRDPWSGDRIVALEIPVFGTFDRHYRIGTLVLTYPWSAIQALLFNTENRTLLVERGPAFVVLTSTPPVASDDPNLQRLRREEWHAQGLVIGRSAPRGGLLANWQIAMLHPTEAATRPLRWVAAELVLLGLVLGIPIVLMGRWLSRRLTAPIADLTRVVGEITDTDRLDARVPVTSSDELGSLARSFNRMTANLERTTREREQFVRELAALNQSLEGRIADRTAELQTAMNAQRRLLGDISHEIKSPLARLSMALGLASRAGEADRPRQFARMEREIANIAMLAGELLTLARLDAMTGPPEFAPVNIAALIAAIVADAAYERPDRAADIVVVHGDAPFNVLGNTDLLRRAFENVIRNAIFYTANATAIEVVLIASSPEAVTIEVRDQGPGVPDAAIEHLFEPFYRVDEARARDTGGSGIGLAICRRVVELHGGTVAARNNQPTGLIITIELPLRPPKSTRSSMIGDGGGARRPIEERL